MKQSLAARAGRLISPASPDFGNYPILESPAFPSLDAARSLSPDNPSLTITDNYVAAFQRIPSVSAGGEKVVVDPAGDHFAAAGDRDRVHGWFGARSFDVSLFVVHSRAAYSGHFRLLS